MISHTGRRAPKTWGERVRHHRENAGKTMGDLARHLGVPVTTVSGLELNRIAPLDFEASCKIGDFLGVDARLLYPEKPPEPKAFCGHCGQRLPKGEK